MVKVDGMVEFIFGRDYHNCVCGDLFVDGDVDAQKKTDEKQGDDQHNKNFTLFPSSHGAEGSLSLRLKKIAICISNR